MAIDTQTQAGAEGWRPQDPSKLRLIKHVRGLYGRGWSVSGIARRLGVGPAWVAEIVGAPWNVTAEKLNAVNVSQATK